MKFNIEEIKQYIEDHPEAKIIIGGDSQKISKKKSKNKGKYARFVTAVVVYQKDANKIFFEVTKEKDVDQNPSKPMMRMLKETEKIVDITMKLMDSIIDRDFEIHLDIASKDTEGSYCALGAAVGYCWGIVGVEPVVKPDAWVSSTVSDHIVKKGL